MYKISPKTHGRLLGLISLLLIGYGLLLCVTNRTEYTLFIKQVSLPRISLGAGIASTGWGILMTLYGLRDEKPEKTRKKRRRRR